MTIYIHTHTHQNVGGGSGGRCAAEKSTDFDADGLDENWDATGRGGGEEAVFRREGGVLPPHAEQALTTRCIMIRNGMKG